MFDPKYIHCIWDESLKGKKVFHNDFIQDIKNEVEGDNGDVRGICEAYNPDDLDHPFIIRTRNNQASTWAFVYYDPYYELKKAHKEGKQLQIKSFGEDWADLIVTPYWTNPPEDYRIKPIGLTILTNHELSIWAAENKGQIKKDNGYVRTHHYYTIENEDHEVDKDLMIRKWGDEDWYIPSKEYINGTL